MKHFKEHKKTETFKGPGLVNDYFLLTWDLQDRLIDGLNIEGNMLIIFFI